jgi:hypothetical protein
MATGVVLPAVPATAGAGLVLRHSKWDGVLVLLSAAQVAVVVTYPSVLVIAIGLWWNANTVAHCFIHRPFFRQAALNRAYSIYLSLLLGFPQHLWRERHLLHHAGLARRARLTRPIVVEGALVFALWGALAWMSPPFFFWVYLPGWAIGLGLCQVQGHFEHAHGTTSHYGRFYNLLFFNDGYHVEHHLKPATHWTELRRVRAATTRQSRWPPVLRWLDDLSLAGLERVVLRSPRLQRWVVGVHERALRAVLDDAGVVAHAMVVGGGLFPRSAIVLRRLNPSMRLTIVERDADHIAAAHALLPAGATISHAAFDAAAPVPADVDLLVIPLGFVGGRRAIYERPPAPRVIVHDWIWNLPPRSDGTSSRSTIVTWLLLKRLTLITSAR